MKTLYLIDRVAIRDRWLVCRRGLVFVSAPDGSAWHAVIHDPHPEPPEDCRCAGPLPFLGLTSDGLRLKGRVQLGLGDERTRTLYLAGVGRLREWDG